MADNSAIVREFVDCFRALDVDRVLSFLTEDVVYHNIPMAPVTGHEGTRGVLQAFLGMASEMEWELHQIAETSEGVVLTERTDRFKVGDVWVELPVMGSFVLRDGKICEWRDYFDLQQMQSQMPGGDG